MLRVVVSVFPSGPFGDRVRRKLLTERVIWFTTVARDGTPQPNPVWFLWDEPSTLLIYNRPDARRAAHIAEHPRVCLNFDGNGRGGDIVVLNGLARIAPARESADQNGAYVDKYEPDMVRVSGNVERFASQYPIAIEVEILKIRGH